MLLKAKQSDRHGVLALPGTCQSVLIEGTSIRSTERITGLHRDTILKLLVIAGENCEKVLRCLIVRVPVRDVQYDEVWGFVLKKEGHKEPAEANDNSVGDAYTFVAIERNTKLVLNLALGRREQLTTDAFIEGLRTATSLQPFQITTDGLGPYAPAIDATLSPNPKHHKQPEPRGMTLRSICRAYCFPPPEEKES